MDWTTPLTSLPTIPHSRGGRLPLSTSSSCPSPSSPTSARGAHTPARRILSPKCPRRRSSSHARGRPSAWRRRSWTRSCGTRTPPALPCSYFPLVVKSARRSAQGARARHARGQDPAQGAVFRRTQRRETRLHRIGGHGHRAYEGPCHEPPGGDGTLFYILGFKSTGGR